MIKKSRADILSGITNCKAQFKVIEPCVPLEMEESYSFSVNHTFYQGIDWSKVVAGGTYAVFSSDPESLHDEIHDYQSENPGTVFVIIEGDEIG